MTHFNAMSLSPTLTSKAAREMTDACMPLGLLEEKGIHHEPGMGKPAADDNAPKPDQSSKGGVTSKLKDKLHLG